MSRARHRCTFRTYSSPSCVTCLLESRFLPHCPPRESAGCFAAPGLLSRSVICTTTHRLQVNARCPRLSSSANVCEILSGGGCRCSAALAGGSDAYITWGQGGLAAGRVRRAQGPFCSSMGRIGGANGLAQLGHDARANCRRGVSRLPDATQTNSPDTHPSCRPHAA